MNKKLLYFACVIFVLLVSCKDQPTSPDITHKAGFCLTFDDTYVKQWQKIIPLLDSNNVKVTFFLTQIYSLSDDEINSLHNFKTKGHEIGSHGWKHIDAVNFLKNHSVSDYIKQEITPAIDFMNNHNLIPKSFSYPYGYNCDSLDNKLLQTFIALRDVEEIQRTIIVTDISEIDDIYYKFDNKKVIPALGIDANFKISISMIEQGFIRASANNEVIIFYAHQTVEKADGAYQTEFSYLKKLFTLARKYNLKCYTFSELVQ